LRNEGSPEGYYGTSKRWTGVWLSNVPATINEGARGRTLLRVFLQLSTRELRFYEWIEQGRSFREFFIPAKVVNARRRSIVPIPAWREYSDLWSP
jgi:hypothetical protein